MPDKRIAYWRGKVTREELEKAEYPFFPNPYRPQAKPGEEFPAIVMLKMAQALALPQPFLTSSKELAKDAGDDFGDDEEEENAEPDSASPGGDEEPETSSGSNHYNPDEPRIPAGQPGGGQWTTGGNGVSYDSGSVSADNVRGAPIASSSSTREYQVADSGQIMTDATITNADFLGYPNGRPIIDPNTNTPYPAPLGMNILDNIKLGQAAGIWDMIAWFQHYGAMDYQRSTGTFNRDYTNVTNYNYGAVSAAAGYSLDETLSNAGT